MTNTGGGRRSRPENKRALAASDHHVTRARALAEMVADTERLGLYDIDPTEVAAALSIARKGPEPKPCS